MLGPTAATTSAARVPWLVCMCEMASRAMPAACTAPSRMHGGNGARPQVAEEQRHAIRDADGEQHTRHCRGLTVRTECGCTWSLDLNDVAAVHLYQPAQGAGRELSMTGERSPLRTALVIGPLERECTGRPAVHRDRRERRTDEDRSPGR